MGSGNETEHVHPFDALLNSKKLTFNEVIYEKMIQEYKPEVNHVDKVSGMTPLEFAVREKNIVIIEVIFGKKCLKRSSYNSHISLFRNCSQLVLISMSKVAELPRTSYKL